MIRIYGVSASRSLRPLWLLEETGIEYEHISIDFHGHEVHSAQYLAINPNGKVPAMKDGELILFESMAINMYIAKKYGGPLFPDSDTDAARANMWSFWVMSEVEHSLLTVLLHKRVLPQEARDNSKVEHNLHLLRQPFGVLNQALQDNPYLLGNQFTVADLNVASVFSWCRPARINLHDWPNLRDWLEKCVKRPACRRAIQK